MFPQPSASSASSSSLCLSPIMAWCPRPVQQTCVDPLCLGWISTAPCLLSDPVSQTNTDPNPCWTFLNDMYCKSIFSPIFVSGPEFTPPPEHHYSHPDRPQPAAWAGRPGCHTGRAPYHSGPLLTAPNSGHFATHVKEQSRLSTQSLFVVLLHRQNRLKFRTVCSR